ncbi:hypothetical protein SLA2020_340350 [Shorea laevis]
MMGTTGTTTTTSGTSSSELQTHTSSDTSECEEEEINATLASTVERIMKNLRQEITQLRRSLEESRYLLHYELQRKACMFYLALLLFL